MLFTGIWSYHSDKFLLNKQTEVLDTINFLPLVSNKVILALLQEMKRNAAFVFQFT